MEEKKSFVLYFNLVELLKFLTFQQRGELITAIFEYVQDGAVQTKLDAPTEIVFTSVRLHLDRDRETYFERCRQNRENGKKGGRPKKIEKTERFFEKPKKPDNDNENGGDNENENETGYENGGGNENDRAPRRMGFLPPTELPPPLPEEDEQELTEDELLEWWWECEQEHYSR